MIKKIALALFIMTGLICPSSSADQDIYLLSVEGVINPVIGTYIESGIQKAEDARAAAVLITLDTPGGLLDATRTAVSAILNTPLPVIVYVSPRGSRATSAGVFITMASDVAAMAPETHIGAAHPVNIGGEAPGAPAQSTAAAKGSVMEEKMVSDAAAYIRTLAKETGRNADWAEKAVRESVSLTAEEARNMDVIEFIAESIPALLTQVHGTTVTKKGATIILDVKDKPVRQHPMSRFQKFLHSLAHPNIAYILLMIGVYGLIYELASPGIGLGGGIGVICLLLAFFSLQVLPINTVGMALLALGILLLVLELVTPTSGLLTIGGLLALGLGSFMLIDQQEGWNIPRVSLGLILPSLAATGLFFGVAVKKIWDTRRSKPVAGAESLIGETAVVREALNPEGLVFLQGELWSAESPEPVNAGEKVVVERLSGNKLIVKKIAS